MGKSGYVRVYGPYLMEDHIPIMENQMNSQIDLTWKPRSRVFAFEGYNLNNATGVSYIGLYGAIWGYMRFHRVT